MAGGFGEAAAAVSFISLTIQLLDGCVKGFTILSDAQGLGSQAEILVCQLDWEHYRLSQWARMVGLHSSPPKLIVADHASADLVYKTLDSLQSLLLDTDALKLQYGLDLVVTDESIREIPASPKHILGRVIGRTKPQYLSDTAKVYQRRNTAWKKLKWSTIDASRFRVLLRDIHDLNERLESLLHPVDQNQSQQLLVRLMRTVIAQIYDPRIIDAISGSNGSSAVQDMIVPTAKLRQQGLSLNLIDVPQSAHHHGSHSATIRGSKAMRRDLSQISCRGHRKSDIYREMGSFDGRPVLLEWKDVPLDLDSKLKYRISNLANFLAEMRDPAFHSLTCVGYTRSSRSLSRYAYLFEPPAEVQVADCLITMEDLIQKCRQDHEIGVLHSHSSPGINARINIALSLSETLLQLHTTGWLHKALRPDNVLFFWPIHRPENGPEHYDQKRHAQIWAPYILGYTCARADSPLETTEDPSEADLAKLYRHPLSLGRVRNSYRQAFDRYSLGCLLIEIGLWTSLPDLLRASLVSSDTSVVNLPSLSISSRSPSPSLCPLRASNVAQVAQHSQQILSQKSSFLSQDYKQGAGARAFAQLEYTMGATYVDLVQRCLHDDRHAGHSDSFPNTTFAADRIGEEGTDWMAQDDKEDDPILEIHNSLSVQQYIVDTLRNLRDAL